MDDQTKQIITAAFAALIRHGMTALGGILTTLGWIKSAQAGSFTEIGTGIALGLIGFAWSLWQKHRQIKLQAKLQDTVTDLKTRAIVKTTRAP